VADPLEPDSTQRVTLSGEFDISTASSLRHSLYDDAPSDEVIGDLSEVTFMDSSGLRALLEVRAKLEADGRRLVLENIPDQVRRLFEVAGITDLFEIR
jgi:anti-sigma B factor antagonist